MLKFFFKIHYPTSTRASLTAFDAKARKKALQDD